MIAALLLPLTAPLLSAAELKPIKPSEFEPLTTVPWDDQQATLRDVLCRLFREPDFEFRYALLAEYLRIIPIEDFSTAFDLCVSLEGRQAPDRLIRMLIRVWAGRDPRACAEKVIDLFHLVGPDDWLSFERWHEFELIVPNREAVKASQFWIGEHALSSFPFDLERSSLSKEEKLQIMRRFMDRWIEACGS
mgnify:FL=1